MELKVLSSGICSVTDLGRFAGPGIGLSVNGALDQYAARVGNLLVGNVMGAPLLELTATALRFAPDVDTLVAVTGAGTIHVGGRPCPSWQAVTVLAGEPVDIAVGGGVRAYVAVHGSFEVPTLLGSCAPDSMVGFGTRLVGGGSVALRRGCDPLRSPHGGPPILRVGVRPVHHPTEPVVDVTDGPDMAEFGPSALVLFDGPYQVSPRSNHVGLRLTGTLPRRGATAEVLSRGVPVGAIEVPSPEGLLALHRGRGVTAGYPVIAVVTSTSLDTLAQVRPGQALRFRRCSLAEASRASRSQRLDLELLRERAWRVLRAHGLAAVGVGSAEGAA